MSGLVKVQKNLMTDPRGNVLLTVTEDQTDVVKAVGKLNDETGGWTKDRTMKLSMSIPVHEYYHWIDKVGEGCWEDEDFTKFYQKHRPEFCL